MPIQFAREPLTDALWAEALPLLEAHWDEVAAFKDIPLEPDRERYANLEENGVLACFTARDTTKSVEMQPNDARIAWYPNPPYLGTPRQDALVGYALYLVAPNAHYKSSLQATQDVIYLDPSLRGTGVGYRFVKFCDQQLASDGVQLVLQHIKVELDEKLGFSRLLLKQGYQEIDRIYGKRLDLAWPFLGGETVLDLVKAE